MSDVYEESYHHLIWGTKLREAMITPRMESLLYHYIRQKCREMKAFVYALNGTRDHVHLVCSIPASRSVSDFMNGVKGSSSHYINHLLQNDPLCWQPGYGHLTFAANDLSRVVAYVKNQKVHHAEGKLSPKMERVSTGPECLSSGPEGLSPNNPAIHGRVRADPLNA